MMKTYEITFIISEKFDEKEIPQIIEKVKKFIPDAKILKENFWGKKQMAYPISKNKFGYYVTLVFQTEPENIQKLEPKFKSAEDIIRFLIVSAKMPAKTIEVKEKKTEKIEEIKPEIKTTEKTKKIEIPKIKVKTTPKRVEKPKKAKITEEIEKEEEKMKALDEKLEEILKE